MLWKRRRRNSCSSTASCRQRRCVCCWIKRYEPGRTGGVRKLQPPAKRGEPPYRQQAGERGAAGRARYSPAGRNPDRKAARDLIDAARNEADEKLSAELSRLEALKAVNPNIRDDELAAIESNRQQVLESLNQAGWRLDALRLIVVTHQ